MDIGLLLKLLHVLSAFWLVVGIVGRQVTIVQAAHSTNIQTVQALTELIGIFDVRMVRPGSMAVLVAGLLTAWAQGWPILGFLQGSRTNWVLASLALYLSIMPLIPVVFLPRGRVFGAALDKAVQAGQVTPELTEAFHDRTVALAHAWEVVAIAAVVGLMVTKPF